MKLFHLFLMIASLFAGSAVALRAEDMKTVQQRMQSRLAEVDSLKQGGLVGEDNRGYLSARGGLSVEQAATVAQENKDRGEVYTQIARRTGGSSEDVGRVRARKIAESSAKGIWVQDEAGNWTQK